MSKMLEGFHVGSLWQVTEKIARRQWDGAWKKEGTMSVLKETGTHTLG